MLFFASFVAASLYRFNDEKIEKNQIVPRFFDMTPGFLTLNLSITKCDGTCEIEIVAFEEVRRKQVFHEKDGYMAFCCTAERKCQNSIDFSDPTPVIRRPIVIKTITDSSSPENDILLEKAVTLSKIDLSSFQSSDIELPRRGIWTVMIANCGDNDVNIEGNATIIRRVGYLDDRLQYNGDISIVQTVCGILYLCYYCFAIWRSTPHLEKEQILVMVATGVFSFQGAISYAFFFLLNSIVDLPIAFTIIEAFIRSASIVFIFYSLLTALQKPVDIPKFKFSLLCIPLFVACFNDDDGYIHFNERETGKWMFGVGRIPYLLFAVQSLIHAGLAYYAYTHKPSESMAGDRRHKLVGIFVGALFGYVFMNIGLFATRYKSNLIATRKSEWVPWTIIPIVLFGLLIANGWFVMNINTEGWVALESGPSQQNEQMISAPDIDPFDN